MAPGTRNAAGLDLEPGRAAGRKCPALKHHLRSKFDSRRTDYEFMLAEQMSKGN